MRLVILSILSILFALPTFSYADPIKIGIITDLSGHGAFWGNQTRLGAQILESELKKEGMDVKFIYADSAFKPSQGVTEAYKLITHDKVDAIFSEFSLIVNAVSPVTSKFKKILVGTCGGVSFLEANPYAFKTYLNYEDGCRRLGEQWKKEGLEKVGILRVNNEVGELCAKGALSVYQDLEIKAFNPTEELATPILSFRTKNIKAIFHSGYEVDALNIFKNLKILSLDITVGGPDSDTLTTKVINTYPTEIEHTITFGYPKFDTQFKEKILKADPKNDLTSSEAIANAYLFLKQLVKVISECPKDEIDCQTQLLSSQGPDPLLDFKGWKDRVADHGFVINKWKGGKKEVLQTYSLP